MHTGRGSPPVTDDMAASIKFLLSTGMMQHDIAAEFGINGGRISEIKTRKKFANVPPANGYKTKPRKH